jgi:hypothetical protein
LVYFRKRWKTQYFGCGMSWPFILFSGGKQSSIPENISCSTAAVIVDGTPSTITVASGFSGNIWYKYTAPESGILTVTVTGSPIVNIYASSNCGSLGSSLLNITPVESGITYLIEVVAPESGSITITATTTVMALTFLLSVPHMHATGNLWQNTGKTIHSINNGDPVVISQDPISGVSASWTNAVLANVSTSPTITFNGTTTIATVTGITNWATGPFSVGCAAGPTASNMTMDILSTSGNGSLDNNFVSPYVNSGLIGIIRNNEQASTTTVAYSTNGVNQSIIFTSISGIPSGGGALSLIPYINGTQYTALSLGFAGDGGIFSLGASGQLFEGNFSAAFLAEADMTTGQITAMANYLNSLGYVVPSPTVTVGSFTGSVATVTGSDAGHVYHPTWQWVAVAAINIGSASDPGIGSDPFKNDSSSSTPMNVFVDGVLPDGTWNACVQETDGFGNQTTSNTANPNFYIIGSICRNTLPAAPVPVISLSGIGLSTITATDTATEWTWASGGDTGGWEWVCLDDSEDSGIGSESSTSWMVNDDEGTVQATVSVTVTDFGGQTGVATAKYTRNNGVIVSIP